MREPRTIKELWKIGNRGLAQYRKVKSDEPKKTVPILTVAVAKKIRPKGLTPEEFHNAFRIACMFNRKEIHEILTLVREQKSRLKKPEFKAERKRIFGTTQLIRVLGVSDDLRMDLVRKVIAENWSCQDLNGHLMTQRDSRKVGGGRPGKQQDEQAALGKCLLLTQRWIHWVEKNHGVLPDLIGGQVRVIVEPMKSMCTMAIERQFANTGTAGNTSEQQGLTAKG